MSHFLIPPSMGNSTINCAIDHVIIAYPSLLVTSVLKMAPQKDQGKISKNSKLQNYLEYMKMDEEIKQCISQELKKKVNTYNRVMNLKKGITKMCNKKPKKKNHNQN